MTVPPGRQCSLPDCERGAVTPENPGALCRSHPDAAEGGETVTEPEESGGSDGSDPSGQETDTSVAVEPGAETRPLWRRNEDRFVELRANYLVRAVELREKPAEAVARSELGYSESGIAKRVDRTEATVGAYLDAVAERFAPEAAHARHPKDLAVDAALPGANGGETA